jgi:hypothetical protein
MEELTSNKEVKELTQEEKEGYKHMKKIIYKVKSR